MNPRLLEAAREGDVNKLQTLLDEDEYIIERSSLDESAETILHVAVLAGQAKFMRKIIDKKPDLAGRLNQDGYSAIHLASANGFVEIVRDLLKFKAELGRLRSSDGRSSLHFAAANGSVGGIRELLEHCPSCKDDLTSRGETALHLAVKSSQFEAFKVMVGILRPHNLKELLNVGDNDGNTVLHYAVAKRQLLILRFLLDGENIEKGTMNVNLVNKSGLTALDALDFAQQMDANPTDYLLREMLLLASASRAKQLENKKIDNYINVTVEEHVMNSSSHWNHFFLKEILALHPARYYKKLAQEVKKSSPETQNALMVVAVLIATVTYQAILNPPNGYYTGNDFVAANLAGSIQEFVLFMAPNTIGFFASIAVLTLLIHEFPLSSLLGLAVRCMAASYICGFLLIGPTSLSVSKHGILIIGIIFFLDIVGFCCRFCRRLYVKIVKRRS